MGQHVSSYKGKLDSTVFGYTVATSIHIKTEKENEDNVLFRPFLYGLSTYENKNSTTNGNNRTDSGFLLCENDSQLWKDLIYVDQTYYKNNSKLTSAKQDKRCLALGSALTFDDIPLTTTQELQLSRRGFGCISPNIGLLSKIRKLDLSFNQLTEIPEEIGYLKHLECLTLSHNKIMYIPDTICYLTQLIELNMSHNQIQQLTPYISHLRGLQQLHLEYNQIKELTVCIDSLYNLNTLDISNNPISILPAEITQLPFLRRLRLDGCPFVNSFDQHIQLSHDPPSLLETCARLIVKNEDQLIQMMKRKKLGYKRQRNSMDIFKSHLTEPLLQYLSNSNVCSFCHEPYFDSYVSRGRWIERNEMWVPLEYRLCSAHWIDEEDRIYAMFSSSCSKQRNKPKTSVFKTKPKLPGIVTSTSSSPKTRKFQLVCKPQRRSSISTTNNNTASLESDSVFINTDARLPATSSSSTTTLTINSTEQQDSSGSPFSTIKRWKFKVRNNSSSFLKKHRLQS